MHLSAVPLLHGIFIQSIKVFMITVYEQNRKRQGFQTVELRIVTLVTVPDTAEIAADDHVIVLGQLRLLRKVLWLKPKWISVKIAGCVNHRFISL